VTAAVRSLKATREGPAGAVRTHERPEAEEERGRVLACAACRQAITTSAARIEVGGAHEHRFTNPHGLQFHIGCFSSVAGCATAGDPETFFTWFPGYSWQVEGCSRCGAHLGWLFRSTGHGFHGLILDRLVELEAGA
jgi:hypothetical protein